MSITEILRNTRKAVALSVCVGLLLLILDLFIDWLVFHKGTFVDLLLLDLSGQKIFMRLLVMALIILFGLLMSKILAEQGRVQRELAEKSVYLDNILRSATEYAIATTDREFRITFYNPMAEKLHGYRAEDVVGRTVQEVHTKEKVAPERFEQAIEKIKKHGEHRYTIVKETEEGTRYINARVSGIYNAGGELVGYANFSRDITEEMKAEEQIRRSLREKEVLLREIHHRVKNNLQVISSLLSLQTRQIKDAHALDVFKESRERINSMALIHEKLYQSKDLANIDFGDYVRGLTSNLFRSYGVNGNHISYTIEVDSVLMDVDTAIACGLIINELVSNSLKYAFPGNKRGEIRINLSRNGGDRYRLVVSDNGVGFPRGLDFRNTETLGLRLVNTLASQLDARVRFRSSGGTTFDIDFRQLRYKERIPVDG